MLPWLEVVPEQVLHVLWGCHHIRPGIQVMQGMSFIGGFKNSSKKIENIGISFFASDLSKGSVG